VSGAVRRRIAVGDVALCVTSEGRGRPVVLLHGFTGCAESMAGVADALGSGFEVHRIDLLGHGGSDAPEDPAPYRMAECVGQLIGVIDALGVERPHWVGYSMGGRVALSLAAARPERVASLLLVGASAGLAGAAERAERVRADEALARRILEDGLQTFVDAWMALPLFASQARLGAAALARAREQRLRCRPGGLAASLRGLGTGAMPPLHGQLRDLHLPVCLVVGREDEKFTALARELAAQLPDARLELVAEAGHAAHLEQPERFARIATHFFGAVDARAGTAAVGRGEGA